MTLTHRRDGRHGPDLAHLWGKDRADRTCIPAQAYLLSAKLGNVTGRALPELVRDQLPRPVTWAMWVQGEVVAMATDVAEFIGAALGLNLLFGVPMLPAGLITGLITFAVLGLRARGRRRIELAIVALLGFVVAGFLHETLRLGPSVPVRCMAWCPALWRRIAVPGRRDPRRHRHAACHLPAFGPDQGPHAQPR
jgi:manganese transport protein